MAHTYHSHNAGYGKLVAILIYYLLFTQVPPLISIVLPLLTAKFSAAYSYIIIVLLTSITVTLLFNGSMYFVYTSKLPFFEQYRVNKDKPWPWEENPEKWKPLLKRSIRTTIFDLFLVAPFLLVVALNLDFYIDMDISRVPSFLNEVLPQFLIMHCFEDLFFFTSHWLLHQPFLYKYHKVHHEYTTTISTAGLYSHLV